LADGDEAYDSVAAELVGLVEAGELEAVGNSFELAEERSTFAGIEKGAGTEAPTPSLRY